MKLNEMIKGMKTTLNNLQRREARREHSREIHTDND